MSHDRFQEFEVERGVVIDKRRQDDGGQVADSRFVLIGKLNNFGAQVRLSDCP